MYQLGQRFSQAPGHYSPASLLAEIWNVRSSVENAFISQPLIGNALCKHRQNDSTGNSFKLPGVIKFICPRHATTLQQYVHGTSISILWLTGLLAIWRPESGGASFSDNCTKTIKNDLTMLALYFLEAKLYISHA